MPTQPSVASSTKRPPGNDPTATQWGRTGEPGSAFNGLGKSNRGKGGGRGRGGRRAGGNSTAHTHPTSPQKSDSISGNSQTTSPPSPAMVKPSSSSLKIPNRQLPVRSAISNEPHDPKKPHSRRQRSNTSRNVAPQQSRNVLSAESRPRKDRTEELPQTLLETKDTLQPSMAHTPNSQNSSSDIKSNIDALVERVRASAMANYRPGTPGSHIDWAGDDDNSLPDLNDWGIKSPPTGHAMISPIIVDGLTPLPELVSLTQSQEDTIVSALTKAPESIDHSRRIQGMTEEKNDMCSSAADGKYEGVTHPSGAESVSTVCDSLTSLHPSLPPRPAGFVQYNGRQERSNPSKKQMKSPIKTTVEMTDTGSRLISPGVRALARSQSQVQSPENCGDEIGLSASIHAPGQQETCRFDNARPGPSISNSAPQVHALVHNNARSVTHSRAHTVGHSSSLHHTRTTSSRTGHQSADHARTQSSPTLTKNNGRSPHSRPMLTGDAISRLARTIGGTTPSPKELSAFTE